MKVHKLPLLFLYNILTNVLKIYPQSVKNHTSEMGGILALLIISQWFLMLGITPSDVGF